MQAIPMLISIHSNAHRDEADEDETLTMLTSGVLELDADLSGYVQVSHGLGVQNLQLDDVGVGHIAVIDDVVFPAQGMPLIGKGNFLISHKNLQ